MARYTKHNGKYSIKSKTYEMLAGTRAQVWHGTAYKTSGGLTKDHLVYINGRVKSKSKHISAKKDNRLVKHGYVTRKGKFGTFKVNGSSMKRKSRKSRKSRKRGGSGLSSRALNPADIV